MVFQQALAADGGYKVRFGLVTNAEIKQSGNILQTLLHCTIPNDGYWLQNANQLRN